MPCCIISFVYSILFWSFYSILFILCYFVYFYYLVVVVASFQFHGKPEWRSSATEVETELRYQVCYSQWNVWVLYYHPKFTDGLIHNEILGKKDGCPNIVLICAVWYNSFSRDWTTGCLSNKIPNKCCISRWIAECMGSVGIMHILFQFADCFKIRYWTHCG